AALLCRLEADKVSLSWAVWIRWCSALRISPSYVIERWQQVGGFAEIASWQQMNNFAQGMATENSEQLEEAFEGKVQPTEKSLTIPKPVKKKLFEEEEFTVRA
ncbi:MAG: hypothetical protein GTN76_08100, partial [Candidatus Aenigmarchaeota archaeon]|nr:hypothetical protein [Candidatus Aenigmarchaeota archaeon]